MTDAIGIIDIECICKCVAHAILKHIHFSQGNSLIDDLAPDDTDIPQFSYQLGKDLDIDLEDIQYKQQLQETANATDYYNQQDIYMEQLPQPHHPSNMLSPQVLNSDLPTQTNTDLYNHHPIDYNYALVEMEEFLEKEGIREGDPTNLVSWYYDSLSLLQHSKPFLFPPPDLGVVESMGSMENTSSYLPSSISTTNVITKALDSQTMNIHTNTDKFHSYKPIIQHHSREEIPWEINAIEDDIQEDIIVEHIDKSLKSSVDKEEGKSSPIMLESYSESLKSCEGKSNGSAHKTSLDGTKESYYAIEDISKEGLIKFLRDAMQVFNDKYSIAKEMMEDQVELIAPDHSLVYQYCRYVVIASKMEKEIPIVALVYLERLLTRTGILINKNNWRRLLLVSLCLASKIWDDESLENEHFPKVMEDVTLKEINTFERVFLDLIGYDLVVKGAEYAKYYFILRTLAEQNNISMPLRPLSFDKIRNLEESGLKYELKMKDKGIDSFRKTM